MHSILLLGGSDFKSLYFEHNMIQKINVNIYIFSSHLKAQSPMEEFGHRLEMAVSLQPSVSGKAHAITSSENTDVPKVINYDFTSPPQS